MKKSSYGFLLFFALLLSACDSKKQAKEQSLLLLPDDLEATLWAESPMFYNPTSMDVDSKGRIWITEAVNYRNYNNDSSAFYHHAKGDRVVILEDADNDGVADRSKVFVQDEDLVSPLGIAVIGNRIFVSCSPHLIVYTDTDNDDQPDEKEILLTGFGGMDHDHSLHAVTGGPDGNLYFTTGNAGPHEVTDRDGWTLRSGSIYTGGSPYNNENQGNLKSDDGKTWVGGLTLRIDPDGGSLKVLAHNFRNSYEVSVDSRGNLWQNDNDDQVVTCRTAWIMEGGNAGYFSADGTRTWQADHRPWQDVYTAHWHQDDPGVMPAGDRTGAGAPTGMWMIEGNELGDQYQGTLLSADAGRNTIFGYHTEQEGSGYALKRRSHFVTSLPEDNVGYVWNDSSNSSDSKKWFRPSDVVQGTDGALYVADWYDPVVGGHQMQDTAGYGRIYRIAPKKKKLSIPEIDLTSTTGQLTALESPAVNVRFEAARQLIRQGDKIASQVKELLGHDNRFVRARAVWLLARLGPEGRKEVVMLLGHEEAEMRMIAFRALRQQGEPVMPYVQRLINDPSPLVRRELICALYDLPLEEKSDALLKLYDSYAVGDPYYLEALGICSAGSEEALYQELLKRQPAEQRDPLKWSPAFVDIMWRLHPRQAARDFETRAASKGLGEAERSRALTALAFIPTSTAAEAMIRLAKNDHEVIREQAIYWTSFRQSNDWLKVVDWSQSPVNLEEERRRSAMKVKMTKLMNTDLPVNERKWNGRDLARDPLGAQMLLSRLEQASLPEEVMATIEDELLSNPDLGVRIQATRLFNKNTSGVNFSIPEIALLKGSQEAGRKTFEASCQSCHRVGGTGGEVGPDLTRINGKFSKEALLDAMVNPSAGIVFGYEPWTIHTTDSTSHFGFLIADSEEAVVIKELSGKRITIPAAKVASRERQKESLMPTPQGLGLTGQDLADITAYLLSLPR